MKKLKVHIKEGKKDWGIFDITRIDWNKHNDKIYYIEVDWFKKGVDYLGMFDFVGNGIFYTDTGNLNGTIIE
ncbi:MAG: hypothetical protein M0R17_14150 [Candidatus Omnitrophica bacterium]|jgi:hypothetical protein|nr:hypothetical protein [Candidatus Omnitrophota bacterium]